MFRKWEIPMGVLSCFMAVTFVKRLFTIQKEDSIFISDEPSYGISLKNNWTIRM